MERGNHARQQKNNLPTPSEDTRHAWKKRGKSSVIANVFQFL